MAEAKALARPRGRRKASPVDAPAAEAPAPPLTVTRPELLVDGSDREFRRLVHALFGFLVRHEAIRSGHGERIGLAGIEYTVLISIAHLAASEPALSVNGLASHLHLSGAFVTTVTNKLARQGLVTKTPDAADRRRVQLQVTDKGRLLLAELAPVQRRVNDIEFESLSREDFKYLLALIERMVDSADRALKLQSYLQDQPVETPTP
ncbi:MarR family winged helix-turn-helix transcriptional regulator [Aquabacter spiritensis]|uniref:MarR family transcriptional regulator n=1 Tax=Aquabacter spiritensis TaxID=933073 RepID=A0A4R3LZN3_9HYPH|nr:MarR family transcriptional regulator [Aquabacter spiritensis]TCT06152.1 MarR family transcriptional regulator [Aquabacter spiritensis]